MTLSRTLAHVPRCVVRGLSRQTAERTHRPATADTASCAPALSYRLQTTGEPGGENEEASRCVGLSDSVTAGEKR